MMNRQFTIWIPLFGLISIFLLLKLQNLNIRASDTHVYFYTAKELLAGKILYKDIFFTNFPLIPYMAIFYFLVSKGNLLFYFFTASLEAVCTTGVLYYIVLKQSKSKLLGITISASYLFSFMILATSDHQSGVFLAALFSILSYLFFLKKKLAITGIFVALAILTKAYTLPLLLSFLLFIIINDRKNLIKFLLGGIATGILVLLPSLLVAPQGLLKDVFAYSLTRSQGVSKSNIIWFTLQHDFIFVVLLISCLILIRKHLFFGLFSLFTIIFFILYKDIYYLYLNVTLPVILLAAVPLLETLNNKIILNRFFITTIALLFIVYNLFTYYSGFNSLQKIPTTQLLKILNKENPPVLYGVNGLTPGLSLLSKKPLLNNIVDTNDNLFRKRYLNATDLTKDAIKQHALVVTLGADYPTFNIRDDALTDVVDKKLLKERCRVLERFPFQSEGDINSIIYFRC